jgi:hypothetical protein
MYNLSKMVRKNYKWNISREDGEKLINEKINEILLNKGEMELSELQFFLLNRSGNITIENNKKKKNLINFIKNVFGGLRNFLENRKDLYNTKQKVNGILQIFVDLNKGDDKEDIYFLNDWVIVE